MTQITLPIFGSNLVANGHARWTIFKNKSAYECKVIVIKDTEGYSSFCENLPGACGAGDTIDECIESIKEVLRDILEMYLKAGDIPWENVEIEGEVVSTKWIVIDV